MDYSVPQDYLYLTRNGVFKIQIETFSRIIGRDCKDHNALQKARDMVPIAQILQDNPSITQGDYKDNLLPHLVNWFSSQFFSWSIPNNCEKCHTDFGIEKPITTPGGTTVITYKCKNSDCDYLYECVRHLDLSSLLRSRKGKSEEWAICFMLFLRALEYEARIVLDTTDNFWNEVWSENQQRWIHVDPYECLIDMPLLYELSWNKKLEYCLAFSQYEVLDVTRRYSAHFDATRQLRKACDENWLDCHLERLTSKLLNGELSDTRDAILRRRFLDKSHLVGIPTHVTRSLPEGTLINEPKVGSIGWRIKHRKHSRINKRSVVIEVKNCDNPSEREALFELRYNSLLDTYESSSPEYNLKGWSSLSFFSENLDHKYERDWKTSYVSRYNACSMQLVGRLRWRFNLTQTNNWSNIEILVDCMIYPKTTIELFLICYDNIIPGACNQLRLKSNTVNIISRSRVMKNTVLIDLVAELAGGKSYDEHAWQKPQLFRQTRGQDDDEWTFKVKFC